MHHLAYPPAGHAHAKSRLARMSYAIRDMWLEYVLSARMVVSHPLPVILCKMNHKQLHHLTRGKDACLAHRGLTTNIIVDVSVL